MASQPQQLGRYSLAAIALTGLLGVSSPATASSVTLCPNAATNQNGAGSFTFTSVAGPLDGTCGAKSAVKMDIAKETDYARLAWMSSDAGYPSPLTLGNLTALSADVLLVAGQPADQPFYMLSFVDATGGLGQGNAANQILMIEFQSSTVSGTTMAANHNTTLFNLYDNIANTYLAGGQADARSVAAWISAYPFLASEAIDQLRIGIGLAGGGTRPDSLTINSLDVTTADATASSVPEPSAILLLGTGLALVAAGRRLKSRPRS
jgi:hypothetical protein